MNWIKNFFVVLISFIFTFITLEIILLLTWENPYSITSPSKIVELRMQPPNIDRTLQRTSIDSNLGPISFRVDENRFILPTNQNVSPEKTIMFMGGSTTQCAEVAEDKRFPNYVSELFKKNGRSVNTINLSKSGNTLHDTINIIFNYSHKFKPDILIVMHAINDGGVLGVDPNYGPRSAKLLQFKDVVKWSLHRFSQTQIGGLLREAITNLRNKRVIKTGLDPAIQFMSTDINYKAFSQRLEIFVEMVRSFEIEPVLMTQPMAEKKNKATPVWSGFERQQKLNDIIREVGVKYGVLIIDLDKHMNSLEDFKENPFKYLYDGVHVSDSGSIEYATYIHKALTK